MKLLTRLRTLRALKPDREPDLPDIARSVAIIMDGNGRWAKKRGLPVAAGHRAGTKALRRTVEAAIDIGVESLCVYAFSTENWSRPQPEVEDLMGIFVETIERELPDLAAQGVRVRFIGRRDRATDALRAKMNEMEQGTDGNERAPALDRVRLRRDAPTSSRRRAGSWTRASTRATWTRTPSGRGSTLPTCRSPTSSSARRASSGSRTSCSGRSPTRSCTSATRSGPISAARDLRTALAEYAGRRRRFGGR